MEWRRSKGIIILISGTLNISKLKLKNIFHFISVVFELNLLLPIVSFREGKCISVDGKNFLIINNYLWRVLLTMVRTSSGAKQWVIKAFDLGSSKGGSAPPPICSDYASFGWFALIIFIPASSCQFPTCYRLPINHLCPLEKLNFVFMNKWKPNVIFFLLTWVFIKGCVFLFVNEFFPPPLPPIGCLMQEEAATYYLMIGESGFRI